ncbi:MAG TPA: murein biosynthesis integral membrane protein MurJ [Planctomycetaceae bacterium]|jgi:putative peptidoglycan lipid II flippase|nr:murein biosynthesis integral membrane protein MurJ [Planctomycetaceae bacterium]
MSTAPASSPSFDKPSEAGNVSAGLRTVSLSTVASRVLGLVRDVAMAAAFGNGPVMDAFSVAFRVPGLARGMFGEGALTAAFLPAFLQERTHKGPEAGWRLASGVLAVLAVGLTILVLAGELLLFLLWLKSEPGSDLRLLLGLTATLLPYLILVCIVAQLNAVMYGLNHFLWPSIEPVLLNVVWIASLWLWVPFIESPTAKIYAVAAAIVASGFFQLAAPLPTLRRLGFRYYSDWRAAGSRLREIGRAMLAVTIGLSVTQLNSLLDGLAAWGFTRPESAGTIAWLPGALAYPLDPGTPSALYFGARVYQFPLGVFGVALGTVLFPILSQHAAEYRMDKLREDLVRGLKLVLFISVPASAGLVVLARPVTILLFQHGSFDDEAVRQTTDMVRMFGCAVWAYCSLLIVHRGFYAVGDRRSPLTMSLIGMAINLSLDVTLIWFMGGGGLALATAVSSIVQCCLVLWLFEQRVGRLDRRGLIRSGAQITVATIAMTLICLLVALVFPSGHTWSQRLLSVGAPMAASLAVYFGLARAFGMSEIALLFRWRSAR